MEIDSMNKELLDAAKSVAAEVISKHQDVFQVYKVPVGNRRLCMSADHTKIVGPDVIVVDSIKFRIGFCRNEIP